MNKKFINGVIKKISGPMVIAGDIKGVAMYEVVRVGDAELMGEVIRLEDDTAFIQAYEDTTGTSVGEPVRSTGKPLLLTLGPGLLGNVFDGIQRPLAELREKSGAFISKGQSVPSLALDKKWRFKAKVKVGDKVGPGDIVGTVEETVSFTHKIMVPPDCGAGIVTEVRSGDFTVAEWVVKLDNKQEISLAQQWPAKVARPVSGKRESGELFFTGRRVMDCLFPVIKGGTACLPGGFGTGKTVLEQSLAKFSAVDVIVYVGCGERGNEMTDVLKEFPELDDPETGGALMDRTVLVVNTSNMPVAAREASVYVGVTIAEYFRDMGLNVAVMIDSTSRWAEALREISSRLEEMPGEEGYPTYLGSRLAAFYERAGMVDCLGGDKRQGTVTIVGAVSPPGGDFSEPVTQSTMRLTGALWALDSSLAHRRHYPAINWHRSYTLYFDALANWFVENVSSDWAELREKLIALLAKEAELQEIVQLVGPDALQDKDRLILEFSRMLREGFLQQNAMSDIDGTCSLKKQEGMLKIMFQYYQFAEEALSKDVLLSKILELPIREDISRISEIPEEEFPGQLDVLNNKLKEEFVKI